MHKNVRWAQVNPTSTLATVFPFSASWTACTIFYYKSDAHFLAEPEINGPLLVIYTTGAGTVSPAPADSLWLFHPWRRWLSIGRRLQLAALDAEIRYAAVSSLGANRRSMPLVFEIDSTANSLQAACRLAAKAWHPAPGALQAPVHRREINAGKQV